MAEERTSADVIPDHNDPKMNGPTPAPTDQDGVHAKSYSADSRPEEIVQDTDPVPLAQGPDKHAAFHVPERDKNVHPMGRAEPSDDTRNDWLMGADR